MAKVRILIVEDNGVVAKDIENSLKHLGYEVSGMVPSAEKAIMKAEEHMPDLVLMDIKLKGEMNGTEAADQIRIRFNIPVVYLTAYTDEDVLERAKITEPFGYIVKPFEERELKTAIEMALYKHKMEKSLKESEDRFRLLSEASFEGICVTEKGIILDANEQFPEMLGYTHSEVIGMEVVNLVTPESRELVRRNMKAEYQEPYEVTSLKKNGSTIQIEAHGKTIPYEGRGVRVTAIRDLSERIRAQEALREREEEYRQLFSTVTDAIIIFDADTKAFMDVNRAAIELYGYSKEEFLNLKQSDITAEPEESAISIQQVLDGELVRIPTRYHKKKDGTVFPVEISANIFYMKNRQVICGVIRDITARKQAEQEKERLESRLQQAQKMEALGTMVSGVAHEINNPVNLIMLNNSLLNKIWRDFQPILRAHAEKEPERKYGGLSYDILKDNLKQLLSDTDMATNRVAGIVQDLKNFSRKSTSIDKKPLQLNTVIESAIRLAHSTIRKSNINLELDLDTDLVPMMGNSQNMEQVVLNLVINAIQAIEHEQGVIRITSGLLENEERLYISVEDNGRGIDKAIGNRIFEPFFTDKQQEDGTGLGLSTAIPARMIIVEKQGV